MSALVLWILIPILAAAILAFIPRRRTVMVQGGALSLILAFLALVIPIDTALALGPFSFKIAGSVQLLGRSFNIAQADGPVLALIYGLDALWFFGVEAAGVNRRLIPLGLAITACLVASLAVEPFLYAALLIEMAAMLAIPLFVVPNQPASTGLLRFLINQTLAMPFILFSGWMLTGVEASPGDLALTTQAAVMLALGFAFLLAIFPLYSWIPMLAEQTSPYVLAFMLWILPMFALIFALSFLDRYAWLRSSPLLEHPIRLAGLLMLVSAGWFAAFQRHLGRLLAYAAIAETGLAILAISLNSSISVDLVFLLFIPRGLELAVWSMGVSIINDQVHSLRFHSLAGLARSFPIVTAGLAVSNLSMAGFPLLAGFPSRFSLWEQLSGSSLGLAAWMLVGLLGILIGAFRTMAVLLMAPENTPWQRSENRIQTVLLGLGIAALFLLGLFPQFMLPFMAQLTVMFDHLAQ